jgi:hypothetical protein
MLATHRLDVPLDAELMHYLDHVVAGDGEGVGHFRDGRQAITGLDGQKVRVRRA